MLTVHIEDGISHYGLLWIWICCKLHDYDTNCGCCGNYADGVLVHIGNATIAALEKSE